MTSAGIVRPSSAWTIPNTEAPGLAVPIGEIAERLEAFAPEVIHSHHPYLLGDSALRAAKQRGLPLVFTHHPLYERYTHYVTPDSEALQRFAVHLDDQWARGIDRAQLPLCRLPRLGMFLVSESEIGNSQPRMDYRVITSRISTLNLMEGFGQQRIKG